MRWNIRIGFLLGLLCLGTSQSNDEPRSDKTDIADAINEFGFKLTRKIMEQDKNGNIITSPTGIAGLLAMTLLGSVGGTYVEIADTLGFSQDILKNRKNHETFGQLLEEFNSNGTSTKTFYADAIFVDESTRLRDVYRTYLKRVYHGEALTTNFQDAVQAKEHINNWVKEHTNAQIPEFLMDLLPIDTRLVLLSALYFSGQWAEPFFPPGTRNVHGRFSKEKANIQAKMPVGAAMLPQEGLLERLNLHKDFCYLLMDFKTPSGKVLVDLMFHAGQFQYIYSKPNEIQILKLPYNDSVTNMYILKPRFPNKINLSQTIENLSYRKIDELINQMNKTNCVIRFPKMELKSSVNLRNPLKALGMKSIFTPGLSNVALMIDDKAKSDNSSQEEILAKISKDDSEARGLKEMIDRLPNPGIHVDSVLHDVKISINEYGTEAVGATAGILARTAEQFYVDSPFYFFIRNEKTKLVTFSAVVYNPL